MKHAAVVSCCAVGVPDSEHGQGKKPVVYIVLNTDEHISSIISEIKETCRKELPEYSQPVGFNIVNELPLTSIGKVDYRALEKMAKEKEK